MAFIAMTLWLLMLSQSATSRICFVIGCLIVTLVHYGPNTIRRNLTLTLPIAMCVSIAVELTFDLSGAIAQLMVRDPTLTGRTEIWAALLNVETNPLIGVGFASFWLGDRVPWLWEETGLPGLMNAHNGFLETYLELGLIGLSLLCIFLIASYRTICRRQKVSLDLFSLSLALWTILIIYNVTEDAFRGNRIWIMFLLVGVAAPVVTKAGPTKREATTDRRLSHLNNRPGAR
jgi:O-antigen ligase